MQIRPLSARSVVLSLLLGAHPPELAVRDLVAIADQFGIAESTLRVALTRMVAAGDLDRADATYRLSARMLRRQERQDAALAPAGEWDGSWQQVVVTAGGRSAADRAELRASFIDLKLAELREGVWMRPANLERSLPTWPANLLVEFGVRTSDDVDLANRLWDLDGWAADGRSILSAVGEATSGAERLALAAALVRHLRTDPALPGELLPAGWPADELRDTYAAYQAELVSTGLAIRV